MWTPSRFGTRCGRLGRFQGSTSGLKRSVSIWSESCPRCGPLAVLEEATSTPKPRHAKGPHQVQGLDQMWSRTHFRGVHIWFETWMCSSAGSRTQNLVKTCFCDFRTERTSGAREAREPPPDRTSARAAVPRAMAPGGVSLRRGV